MNLVERIWGKETTYESEKEILTFGYDMIKTMIIGFFIAFAIAFLFREIKEAVIFLILLMPLRQNAGGFHAKTRLRCAVISLIIYIGALTIFKYVYLNKFIILCLFIIFSLIIAMLQ